MADQEYQSFKKVCISSQSVLEDIQQLDVTYYDDAKGLFMKIKLKILFSKNSEIEYQTEAGNVLRIDYMHEQSPQPQIMKNLEQIKDLQWHVQDEKNKKNFLNGELLGEERKFQKLVGSPEKLNKDYTQKKGKSKNYWSQAQVFEKGRYKNNLKIGQWSYILKEKKIGGGLYNKEGLKTGNWVELFPNLFIKNQVFQIGEYINGKKVGKWIMKMNDDETNKQIFDSGGGYYDKNNLKQGKWTELNENYHKESQVTHKGLYYNDLKVDKWVTYQNKKLIGGGSYDKNNLKNGKWIELIDNFYWQKENFLLVIVKSYFKVNIKMVKNLVLNEQFLIFKILSSLKLKIRQNSQNKQKEIQKILLLNKKYISYNKWDILDLEYNIQKIIGGGLFNQQGQQNGLWNEIGYNYSRYFIIFTQIQQYQLDDNACGRILKQQKNRFLGNLKLRRIYVSIFVISFVLIHRGGGTYNQSFQRNGKWIEPDHDFNMRFLYYYYIMRSETTWKGEYKNSKKIGKWIIRWEDEQYGGGYYNDLNMKQGKWVEMSEIFMSFLEIYFLIFIETAKLLMKAIIKMGKKLEDGILIIQNKQLVEDHMMKMVQRMDNGQISLIIFMKISKQHCQGSIEMVKKLVDGLINMMNNKFSISGGGSYNQQGQKRGQWIELSDDFYYGEQVSYKGFYKNNKKVGKQIEMKGGL